jgi:L-asparagine oxygenase
MVGYEAEGGGRLFQDMVPSKPMEFTQTSQSSRVELESHVEQAFSPLRPDFVSLGCLRGDPYAATYTFTATDLLERISPAEEAMLRKPLWTLEIDESFRVDNREFVLGDVRGPWPLLSGPAEDPMIIIDQDLQHGVTRAAQALLHKIIDIYCLRRRQHILAPGDVLLLDNSRAMHGRSAFRPKFDGSDRFVIRSFVVHDLARSRHARPGGDHIIAARYS